MNVFKGGGHRTYKKKSKVLVFKCWSMKKNSWTSYGCRVNFPAKILAKGSPGKTIPESISNLHEKVCPS
jgi:hypothetical protein